jgi:hypothetical protein
MARRKKIVSDFDHLYQRVPYYDVDDKRRIESGEIVKVKGVWGTKFRFMQHTKRLDNGNEWIDLVMLERGVGCGQRSFYPDRIKPLPKKRRKKKAK